MPSSCVNIGYDKHASDYANYGNWYRPTEEKNGEDEDECIIEADADLETLRVKYFLDFEVECVSGPCLKLKKSHHGSSKG